MSLIDPIDRNALMVALKRKMPISDTMVFMFAKCLEEVRNAPTIEPEPHWIPVSEKAHPTKEGTYLVTDDAGGMAMVDVDDFVYCDDGSGMWMYSQNVTAWKPAPKPYREEGEK